MVEFGVFKANIFANQRLPYGIQFFICQKITEFDRYLKKDGGCNSQSIVTITAMMRIPDQVNQCFHNNSTIQKCRQNYDYT